MAVARKLSIYINEGDLFHGKPLYLELLEFFRRQGCSGATVLRAVSGFTASAGTIQTTSIVALAATRLPLVVEMVEAESRIRELLPQVRDMVSTRLVTLQDVEICD